MIKRTNMHRLIVILGGLSTFTVLPWVAWPNSNLSDLKAQQQKADIIFNGTKAKGSPSAGSTVAIGTGQAGLEDIPTADNPELSKSKNETIVPKKPSGRLEQTRHRLKSDRQGVSSAFATVFLLIAMAILGIGAAIVASIAHERSLDSKVTHDRCYDTETEEWSDYPFWHQQYHHTDPCYNNP